MTDVLENRNDAPKLAELEEVLLNWARQRDPSAPARRTTTRGRQAPARLEDRVTVQDYRALGQIIIDWTLGRRPVPKSIDELRAALLHIAEIPASYTALNIVPSDSRTFTFRLPEPDLLQASIDKVAAWDEAHPEATREEIQDGYALPRFYDDLFQGDVETSATELFQRRIGDYIIASCK
jgi:hypothetical protein